MNGIAKRSTKHANQMLPLVVTMALTGLLWIWDPEKGAVAFGAVGKYGLDLLFVLPAVMLLTALFKVWVPEPVVERLLGQSSGWKGLAMSLLFGSIMEGPLYVGFPIAKALTDKGARVRNAIAFLTIWACGKIPQVMMEARFLGITFSALRVTLSIGAAIAIGWIVEKSCHFAAPVKAPGP